MSETISASSIRRRWFSTLFPNGVPKLWCPPLTHYTRDGQIDRARGAAHLESISPWVGGLLVPGSTGDGWELTPTESREVLEIALNEARRLNLVVLAGALRPVASDARQVMVETTALLKKLTGAASDEEALVKSRVCGFALCPPRGKEIGQEEMGAAFADILSLGLPAALYQLPQVTENEMSPELVSTLARRFGNFLLFKDTSGRDLVAASGQDTDGVFLARGAEGDYARWLKTGGGVYDGFLLSTANGFAPQLHHLTSLQARGMTALAEEISARLSAAVEAVFALVRGIPDGNAFANAGKAVDHFRAHGSKALTAPPPRLHAGSFLPVEVIHAAGGILARHGLMPAKGYLE